MVRIISVEGNIGAGKTTLLDELETCLLAHDQTDVIILREPVDQWTKIYDAEGKNILERFYEDPVKHSFQFQVLIFTTMLDLVKRTVEEQPDCSIIVCERSLETSRFVFAKMLHDDGLMSDMEYKIYETLFADETIQQYLPTSIVYLPTDNTTCMERIRQRNRSGEQTINETYLDKCQAYYDEYRQHSTIEWKILTKEEASISSVLETILL